MLIRPSGISLVCGLVVVVWGLSDWLAEPLPAEEPVPAREILNEALTHFVPLPKSDQTKGDRSSPEQIELGRKLFFDPRISADGVRSCALCHQPSLYGTDGLALSRGVDNILLGRNAPTILNAAFQFRIHWDGRFASVEEQAQAALTGPAFHNPSDAVVISRIEGIPGYTDQFRRAFPDQKNPVTTTNWGEAIGAYERTLTTPSRFDDFLNGDEKTLNPSQLRGLRLFSQTGCADCHSGALLGGHSYEKFGVMSDYWNATGSKSIDKGRYLLTGDDKDIYTFKVAPLRNVVMTPPYFHDGSVRLLTDAVQIMAKVQLGTTFKSDEVQDIVSFLESLTGALPQDFSRVPELPPAAFQPTP